MNNNVTSPKSLHNYSEYDESNSNISNIFLSEQEINNLHVQADRKIGKGGYGDVFHATIGSQKFIVKRPINDKKIQSLEKEFKASQKLVNIITANTPKEQIAIKNGIVNNIVFTRGIANKDGKFYGTIQDYVKGVGKNGFSAIFKAKFGPYFGGYINNPSSSFDRILLALQSIKTLHEHEFIHRDIKLGNFIIEDNPNENYPVYLIDLGAIRSLVYSKKLQQKSSELIRDKKLDDLLQLHRKIVAGGTYSYLAPELKKETIVENYNAGILNSILFGQDQEIYAFGLILPSFIFGDISYEWFKSYLTKSHMILEDDKETKLLQSRFMKDYYNRPHEDLQQYILQKFIDLNYKLEQYLNGEISVSESIEDDSSESYSGDEDSNISGSKSNLSTSRKYGYDQMTLEFLARITADCLMMQPRQLYTDKNVNMPYFDEHGNTNRRPAANELYNAILEFCNKTERE